MEINAKTLIVAAAVAALFIPLGSAGTANAANKSAAAAGDFKYLGTAVAPLGATSILDTFMKVGGPQDAIVQVSLECSLVTDVNSTTVQDHPSGLTSVGEAEAHVVVWATIDGVPLTVGPADSDGKVTFCDRVHQQEINDVDESTGNFTIRQLQKTMSANAFNWVVLDLGSGIHHFEIWATIEAANTQGSFAEGAIEKRTLVVEPIDFAQGGTVSQDQAPASSDSGASVQTADTPSSGGSSLFDFLFG